MQRILITGATGFVGANVARHFVARGDEVHLLVRSTDSWRLESVKNDLRWHIASLLDADRVTEIVASVRPDWVFHLAAYGSYSTQGDASLILKTNLEATINLLDAAAGVGFEVFVNTGSSSEYGFCDHAPAESELPVPNSTYAYSKVAATIYCSHVAKQRNLRVTTLRLYSVYGPYEEPTRFVPRLVTTGLRGAYPPLVDPSIARDFVHIDDAVRAYELVARSSVPLLGDIFNVGTGVQTTIGEAAAIARSLFGIADEPRWGSMENRAWDTGTWVANARRIAAEVGWRPTMDFRAGCSAFAEWFRADPQRLAFYDREREPPR